MPKKFPPEFKRDVVAVARRGDLSVAEVAVDFGVAEETVRRWMRQADVDVDVGLAHPAPDGLLSDSEVDGDLSDAQIAPPSDSDYVTLELWRELLGHGDILPAGGNPTLEMSTRPTADPQFLSARARLPN